jgi:hypothetical protein
MLGDVHHDAAKSIEAAVVEHHGDDVPEPDGPSVGGHHPVLEIVVAPLPRGLGAELHHPVTVVGMDVRRPETGLQPLRARIAEQPLGLLTDEGEDERRGVAFPDDSPKVATMPSYCARLATVAGWRGAMADGILRQRPAGANNNLSRWPSRRVPHVERGL